MIHIKHPYNRHTHTHTHTHTHKTIEHLFKQQQQVAALTTGTSAKSNQQILIINQSYIKNIW